MSVKRWPRAGRAVVEAKIETEDLRMEAWWPPAAVGLVRVLRRRVRMLWVWERVRRVREKVARRVCA
jgi:hypothetical protein